MNDEVCLFEDQMRSVYPKYVHSCPFTPFHQPSASSSCSTSNHHHHPSNHFQHQIHHHNAHVWVLDHSNILMFCRKKFLSLRSSKFNYVYTNYCSIATGHCPIYKYVCVAPYCHSPTIIDFGVSACVLSSKWPYLDVCI